MKHETRRFSPALLRIVAVWQALALTGFVLVSGSPALHAVLLHGERSDACGEQEGHEEPASPGEDAHGSCPICGGCHGGTVFPPGEEIPGSARVAPSAETSIGAEVPDPFRKVEAVRLPIRGPPPVKGS